MKTFQCDATITLKINIDVDAEDREEAKAEAEKTLQSIFDTLPKHTDNAELNVLSVEEK